jgi:hypothetical protein
MWHPCISHRGAGVTTNACDEQEKKKEKKREGKQEKQGENVAANEQGLSS